MFTIRRAVCDDAPAIATVHVDSWRTTYKNIIPNDVLKHLSYEKRTELWNNNIRKDEHYVLVVENNNGQIVGFADAWNKATDIEEHTCHLASIYLLEDYQGKGIGKMLLKELFNYFKQSGYKKIYVEVLEENKTRYFYEYYGAKLLKSIQIIIGGKVLNELIYEWDNIDDVLW